jgi:hypothetical protein
MKLLALMELQKLFQDQRLLYIKHKYNYTDQKCKTWIQMDGGNSEDEQSNNVFVHYMTRVEICPEHHTLEMPSEKVKMLCTYNKLE